MGLESLSTFLCVSDSLSLPLCLSVSLCLSVTGWLSLPLRLSISLCVSVSLSLPLKVSVCMSVSLSRLISPSALFWTPSVFQMTLRMHAWLVFLSVYYVCLYSLSVLSVSLLATHSRLFSHISDPLFHGPLFACLSIWLFVYVYQPVSL